MVEPVIPFLSNKSGQVESNPKTIKEHLAYQITNGVPWVQAVNNMVNEHNIVNFVECGTANVLTNLFKRFDLGENAVKACFNSVDAIKEF